jgi:DNA-binding beta-propeller fold protein YncE
MRDTHMAMKRDSFFLLIFFVSVVSCSQENLTTEASCGVTNTTQNCYCSLDLMGTQTCTESSVWTVCECIPVPDWRDIALEPDIGQEDGTTDAPLNDSSTEDNGGALDADLALNDSPTQEIGTSSDADLTPDETPDAESDVSVDIPVVGDVTDAGEVLEDVGPEEDLEPEPVIDCAAVSLGGPPEIIVHETLIAYHGLAFDNEGNYYGVDNDRIYSAPYGEPATPFGGEVAWMEQLELLPDGDLVACGDSAVYRISMETGGSEPLDTGISCYGIRVGPDDMVYIATGLPFTESSVYRIDPDTGERSIFVEGDGFSPRVIDFSPDASRLYMGTNSTIGDTRIWYVDLDEEMNVISAPAVFTTGVGSGYADGLGVDICGNVYVAEFYTGGMYRITPDATNITTLWSFSGDDFPMYGHGIAWGSGVGGWDDHSLFIPQPFNGSSVGEVYIGFPYRTWEGTVLNRIPML